MSYHHSSQKIVKCNLLLLSLIAGLAGFAHHATAAIPPAAGPEVLPAYASLLSLQQQQFQLRSRAPAKPDPTLPVVVLLAGPNQNFHADSAWYALLQPLLAQQFNVVSIDRTGNGFSSDSEAPSYRRFAAELAQLLPKISERPVILVSFASASISAMLLQQQCNKPCQVKAMLWIDPDVPTPAALALYQGYPVDWYQQNLQALLPQLAKGIWNERTTAKLAAEREEVAGLIPAEFARQMDWAYFDAISQQRLKPNRQQQRAMEIAAYSADLQQYARAKASMDIPISVIDSDFENADINANPAQAAALQLWQQQGSQWSQQLAEQTGGQYLPLANSHHLVMLQRPASIVTAIQWLARPATATR